MKELKEADDPRAATVVGLGGGGRDPNTLLHQEIKSEAEESSELEVIQESNLKSFHQIVKSSSNLTAQH